MRIAMYILGLCIALVPHTEALAQKKPALSSYTGVFCQSREQVSSLLEHTAGGAMRISQAIEIVNALGRSQGVALQGPACRFLENQPGLMQPAGSLLVKTSRLNQVYHVDKMMFVDGRTGRLHPIAFWGFRLMEPNELPI